MSSPVVLERPLSPYIIAKDAARAIRFYCDAFNATELFRLTDPSGKIGHAELRIGQSTLMVADEFPDFGAQSPHTLGGTPVSLHIYLSDVDATVKSAVERGATLLRPVKNEFYGDRVGLVLCPFGHKWFLATRLEEMSAAEMQRRMNAECGVS
jgi:PhnB protein